MSLTQPALPMPRSMNNASAEPIDVPAILSAPLPAGDAEREQLGDWYAVLFINFCFFCFFFCFVSLKVINLFKSKQFVGAKSYLMQLVRLKLRIVDLLWCLFHR